jgi:TAT (twin-arginine translocation) pathway signal sequence
MTIDANSTRRSFLKGGAVLAAPLAVALPAAVMADEGLKARLARLEDESAIRELHQTWLRRINTGVSDANAMLYANPEGAAFDQVVRGIAADHGGQPDAIELAADGNGAAGRFHCAVEIETRIEQNCTLARMAHAQGGGFVRRTERRVLKVEYVKASGAWVIAKVEFQTANSSKVV